ncbi:CTD nuclear envelope phosphatase 1 [Trachemys scripta elegans]|nr:CTD nuclear envelope phosphatase 1 [Trachemys scripta elegans]
MLGELVAGATGGLVLIEDTIECEGRSLLKTFVAASAHRGESVHVFGFEIPEEEFRAGFDPDVTVRLLYQDGFTDPLRWTGEAGGFSGEEFTALGVSGQLARGPAGPATVVLDSLSWLLLRQPLPAVCQALGRIPMAAASAGLRVTRILALLHGDLHPPGLVETLRSLARAVVGVGPAPEGVGSGGDAPRLASMLQRKETGKVLEKVGEGRRRREEALAAGPGVTSWCPRGRRQTRGAGESVPLPRDDRCWGLFETGKQVIQYQTVRYDVLPLSPAARNRLNQVKRKVLVLDLDETLIHSHHDGVMRPTVRPGTPPDFILKVVIDKHPVRFFVHKRPHVDFFLEVVSQWYELVVFTASMEIYGSAVADKLDNNRSILKRRYYRQHCTLELGSYIKDLSVVHSDLSSVVILDNSPGAYRSHPDNAIPIKSWFSDPSDTALLNLLPMLDALRFTADVRSVLSRNLHQHRLW